MDNYSVLKIAIGLRYFPELSAIGLAKKLKLSLRTVRTHFESAKLHSKIYIPNLVTEPQLVLLSGADLTVLYYLYTADPSLKNTEHCYTLNMSNCTFAKALCNLRAICAISERTSRLKYTYNIKTLPEFANHLN